MNIREVDLKEKNIIKDVVAIHLATFQGFFLTFMGKGFLTQLYTSYCSHPESGLLAAFDDGIVVGFLAYSENLSGLYKYMIRKRLLFFAWYSVGAFFRKPKVFMRLLRAFLKPGTAERKENYIELASIGVNPEFERQGVGTMLVSRLKETTDFLKFAYISLETDAENNESANQFYKKNEFVLVREYLTREGRKMNEYRYRKADR